MRNHNEAAAAVDTSSPDVLVSDVKHGLQSAIHAIDAGAIATAVWALEHAVEKMDELGDALENLGL